MKIRVDTRIYPAQVVLGLGNEMILTLANSNIATPFAFDNRTCA